MKVFLILIFSLLLFKHINGDTQYYMLHTSNEDKCIKIDIVDTNKFSVYVFDLQNYENVFDNDTYFGDILNFACHDVVKCQHTIGININEPSVYFMVISYESINSPYINELNFCHGSSSIYDSYIKPYIKSYILPIIILIVTILGAILLSCGILALCALCNDKNASKIEQNNDEYGTILDTNSDDYIPKF